MGTSSDQDIDLVAKAIELFLGCLVKECVKQAEARGSKKITAFGLCVYVFPLNL